MSIHKHVSALLLMLLLGSVAQAEVVKIGFIDVLSGPVAAAGKSSLDQLRAVVTARNAKAKPTEPQFEVVPFDGKGSPQESALMLKSASDQGIRYVTQGGGSGVAFALTEGSEQRAPMGQAVIGGVITSSLLTLVVVPVVYCYIDDFSQWLKKLWHGKSRPTVHPAG
jgi:hypothetical protein